MFKERNRRGRKPKILIQVTLMDTQVHGLVMKMKLQYQNHLLKNKLKLICSWLKGRDSLKIRMIKMNSKKRFICTSKTHMIIKEDHSFIHHKIWMSISSQIMYQTSVLFPKKSFILTLDIRKR